MIRFTESQSSNSRLTIIALILLLVISGGCNIYFLLHRAAPTATVAEQKWTCGMHPQVIEAEPGICPICGMNLTPMNASSGTEAGEHFIQIDPTVTQNMGLKTVPVMRQNLNRVIRTTGIVAVDEARTIDVSLRYMGWIEELHANKTGQFVEEGEPLFEIFSPDLLNAQDAYINSRSSAQSVVNSARQRLINYGMSEEQIMALDDLTEALPLTTVYSPASGFIVEKSVSQGTAAMAGETLLTISANDRVWIQAQIYDYDLSWIHVGSTARIKLDALDQDIEGTISFIYPTIDTETRAARARIRIDNPDGLLKPEMIALVYLSGDTLSNVLAVPRDAVMRSGKRDLVFVEKEEGKFEPRVVRIGLEADHYLYEIVSGLREGERVVTHAAFLLDSETQIQEVLHKLDGSAALHSAPPDSKEPQAQTKSTIAPHEPGKTVPSTPAKPSATKVAADATMDELFLQARLFVCSTHPEIIDDEAGTICPLCKTELLELDSAEISALRKAEPFGCVMCPVVVPGFQRDTRCPICNMKLTAIENPKP